MILEANSFSTIQMKKVDVDVDKVFIFEIFSYSDILYQTDLISSVVF